MSKLKISECIVDSSGRAQLTSLVHSGGYLQDPWTLFIIGQLPCAEGKVDYNIDLRLLFCWLGVIEG